MKTDRIRAVLLFFWVGLTITMNILAEVIPLGGQTTGRVFDRNPTLITPAGYAFSLWILIYAGLAGLAVYQALPRQQRSETLRAIRGPLLVSLAANVAWVLAWHHDWIGLSLVALMAALFSLVTAYTRLDQFPVGSRAETWLVRAPVSVYLGWVTVATAVNAAVWLRSLGWDGGDAAPFWAVIALGVVTLVCGAVTLRQQDWAFALTALWALTAIAVQQSDTPSVAATALLAASVIAFAKLMGGLGSGPTRVRPASDTGQRGSLPPRRAA